MTVTAIIAVVVFFFIIIVFNSIKVVREYKRLVVFRLGRSIGAKGPGIVILWPVIDKAVWIDLREIFQEIPQQTCISKDNAPINIDFLIYLKVIDPVLSVINVQNFLGAAQGIATTTLRAVVGDIPLDDVLAKREQINQTLRLKLDEVTERWGIKVTSVEIREITPPKDIQDAMNKQMAAERSRRATVLEADGKKIASIAVAEGAKQASILQAEGERQSLILKAEGNRQSANLNAEGYALALGKIFEAAKLIDSKTMSLQYLEALKALGQGASTKFIFPMEFSNLLAPFIDHAKSSVKTEK